MSGPWKLRGYVVERLLGAGASGEVWRARVAATGELVALKRLPPMDSRESRRLHTEAAMLSALDHPNLIRLHAVVPDEQAPGGSVLVLDLAEGGSLAQLLTGRGRLSPGEAVTALAPVAAAVAYAHTQGVVHGDISAANVLFTAEGTALLADLGVARLVGDDRAAESTPAYVDPAVAVGCVPAPSSDVFMLGGVALHALTGAPPWPGDGDAALTAARAGALTDVADRLAAASVPEPVANVVTRALCPDSFRRGSAADFALDLRAAAEPTAVELRAGRGREALLREARSAVAGAARGRPRGGRHAAVAPGAPPPLPWQQVAAEPAEAAETPAPGDRSDTQPPTRLVHARPRPQLPPPRRRRPTMRRFALGAVALLVLGLAAAVVLRSGRGSDAAAAAVPGASPTLASPSQRTAATSASAAVAMPPPGGTGAAPPRPVRTSAAPPRLGTPAGGPAAVSPAGWAGVLAVLDRRRERAFATRQPALLRGVYAEPRLRRADSAQLTRLVPPGCGLRGVHTTYRQVHAMVIQAATVRLTAVASLPPSRLVCGGRRRATARGVPPVPVRIVLRHTRAGLRIAGEQWSGPH